MNSIGGNKTALIQVKTETGKNRMGEKIIDWQTVNELAGFLDLTSGDSHYTNYNAKLQESTHIFIADYKELDLDEAETRVVIDNKIYDVKLIDDPMGMHEHLELYLAFVG